MAKALGAHYDAGARGAAWLKVKPAHTLDLVVLAAELGPWPPPRPALEPPPRRPRCGRRRVRDAGEDVQGMTDEMLEWQTAKLLELETRRDAHVVFVRPELVVEVAFNGIQASPPYSGGPGAALRARRALPPGQGPGPV